MRIFVNNFSLLSPLQRVQNFQLVCYSQRVNATSQYNDSGSSKCSKWPNDRDDDGLYKEEEVAEKDDQCILLLDRCSRKYWHVLLVVE